MKQELRTSNETSKRAVKTRRTIEPRWAKRRLAAKLASHPDDTSSAEDQLVLDIGLGLIETIVGRFEDVSSPESAGTPSSAKGTIEIQCLIRSPPAEVQAGSADFSISSLPRYETAVHLTDVAFDMCYRLNEIVPRDAFQQRLSQLYSFHDLRLDTVKDDFIPLLHVVIALSYTVNATMHQQKGCDKAIAQGIEHFNICRETFQIHHLESISLMQLRTVLCMILFQLFTKGAAATEEYLRIVYSAVLTLGLYDDYAHGKDVKENMNAPKQNLFWTVLWFDVYISGLLGRQPHMEASFTESATLGIIHHAAQNVSKVIRSSQSLLVTVALAMQIELFKIMKRIARIAGALRAMADRTSGKRETEELLANIGQISSDLVDWEVLFTNIYPRDEVNNLVARTRYELQMTYYQAQILLCSHFIRYHCDQTSLKDPFTVNRIEFGQKCLKIAKAALAITNDHTHLPGHPPFSEPSAYILFVSLLCLVSAVRFANEQIAIELKGHIWQGLWFMANMACMSHSSTLHYLRFLQDKICDFGLESIPPPLPAYFASDSFTAAAAQHPR